jgi:hypothetical protein
MRITGKNGQVAIGASPEQIIGSVSSWDQSETRNSVDVTAFTDPNKVSVMGTKNLSGTIKGFYNMDDGSPEAGESLPWFEAADSETPVLLKLWADIVGGAARYREGLAYLDMKIDCQVAAAVTLESAYNAAGPWTRH